MENNFVFGIHSTIEAILSGKEVDRILIKKGLQGENYLDLMDLIREHNLPYQMVPVEKIDRITRKNHQGVVAFISPIPFHNIEGLIPTFYEEGKNPLLLILDQITDVRNFGAIARTAEVAGVDAIIIPEKGAAQINADAIKTSSGALMTLPVCRTKNLVQTIKFLQNSGFKIIAATEKGAKNYFETDMTNPTAIVMGSEEFGIESGILKIADELAKIPQSGKIQSLNVSVACGVLVFEAVRQRLV